MRRPRFQFSLRGLMIAVAVAGVAAWLMVMLRRYREKAAYFRYAAAVQTLADRMSDRHRRRMEYFLQLADKYDRAAWYPWLPVSSDPPEPE